MNRLLISLGKAYPKGTRRSIGKLMLYAGNSSRPESWLGTIFLLNLLFVAALVAAWFFVLPLRGLPILMIIAAVIGSVAIQAAAYLIPYYAGTRRANSVEAVLPNFYQLMASYLRSGMTPFQALKSASKKEFGLLKAEVDIATSKALGTQSFTDALSSITQRIRSDSLQRSTELMIRAMESGGSLASLLEESAANLIENRSMKKEIIASSRTYTLMIVFAVLIGAPLLLSISTRFNERLIGLTEQIGEGAENIQGLESGMLVSGVSIDPQHLIIISTVTIAITAFISSLLVGIIQEGSEKYGLKYALLFVPVSIVLFWVFTAVLSTIF